jgi:hypothetical protein
MGRPKLKKKDAKGVLISIRILPLEKKALEKKAKDEGVTLSKLARKALLSLMVDDKK